MAYNELKKEKLSDSNFKDTYNRLQPLGDIASLVTKHRTENGMTQKQLAEITGIPQADISRLENIDGNPTLETLTKLAKAFGTRVKIDFVSD